MFHPRTFISHFVRFVHSVHFPFPCAAIVSGSIPPFGPSRSAPLTFLSFQFQTADEFAAGQVYHRVAPFCCQSHYFDCEYEKDEQGKGDGGLSAGTPMFISEVMHGTACALL